MQTKVTTWKELEASIAKLPADMQQKVLPNVRNTIYKHMAKLEAVAQFIAYQKAPGTQSAPKTGKLVRTIDRFKNKSNPNKAYVVLGLKTTAGRFTPAYYGGMQLAGYAPGRHSSKEKSGNLKTRNGKTTTNRAQLRLNRQVRQIPGKDYFAKADERMGYQVEEAAWAEAIKEFEKMLDRM